MSASFELEAKEIIWDLDGTLIESFGITKDVLSEVFNTFGRLVGIFPVVIFGGLIQSKGYFNASLLITFVALMATILGLLAIKFHRQNQYSAMIDPR